MWRAQNSQLQVSFAELTPLSLFLKIKCSFKCIQSVKQAIYELLEGEIKGGSGSMCIVWLAQVKKKKKKKKSLYTVFSSNYSICLEKCIFFNLFLFEITSLFSYQVGSCQVWQAYFELGRSGLSFFFFCSIVYVFVKKSINEAPFWCLPLYFPRHCPNYSLLCCVLKPHCRQLISAAEGGS